MSKKNNSYKDKLLKQIEKYYYDNGILSTRFNCPFKKLCKGDNDKFYGPKSTYISQGYEKGEMPRLLLISLDPGDSDKNPQKRTPKSVRSILQELDTSKLYKNRHWYKTHELAFIILKRFDNSLTIENVKYYFAHANTVKCSANNPNHKQASKVLFMNCRNYLLNEIYIMKPDILITQGKEAQNTIEYFFSKAKLSTKMYQQIEIENKKVFWLHTVHPSNYGAFYKQYYHWDKYSEKIYNWYTSRTD